MEQVIVSRPGFKLWIFAILEVILGVFFMVIAPYQIFFEGERADFDSLQAIFFGFISFAVGIYSLSLKIRVSATSIVVASVLGESEIKIDNVKAIYIQPDFLGSFYLSVLYKTGWPRGMAIFVNLFSNSLTLSRAIVEIITVDNKSVVIRAGFVSSEINRDELFKNWK